MNIHYYLLNPTGNITALVTDAVAPENQPAVAAKLMTEEASCEQVGFLFKKEGADMALRMAGGEFCGNATMCAGYLSGKENPLVYVEGTGMVPVKVAERICDVTMPLPLTIAEKHGYPTVVFPGISHMIIEGELNEPEKKIVEWCEEEALGFLFLRESEMKPLVYVRKSNTLFWERSCASGSSAVGAYLVKKYGGKQSAVLEQPGGTLTVVADAESIHLIGKVEILKSPEQF